MASPLRVTAAPPARHLTIIRDSSAAAPLGALRVPLAVKLVGANALALLVFASTWLLLDSGARPALVLTLFIVLLGIHLMLALVALRPIRDLETLALRVWGGDTAARFRASAVADDKVLRVGVMFNTLLDGLIADRASMRLLAEEVVAVGDRERAALARELHDSTAQRLAALLLQISSAARDAKDPALSARLSELRDAAEELTNDVRLLASSVHPRVLDDLGLIAAVRKLARDTTRATGTAVHVIAPDQLDLPQPIAAVLYRVAQEALRNATSHGGARSVQITAERASETVSIEVADDGRGFDASDCTRRGGMGLLTMQERISLVDGTFEVRSDSRGTTVLAIIPMGTTDNSGAK